MGNVDQPRDEHGRFTGGSWASIKSGESKIGGSKGGPPAIPPLFKKEELALPKEFAQKDKTPEALFESAKKGQAEQLALLDHGKGIDKDIGATVVRGDKLSYADSIAAVAAAKGPVVQIGPMKRMERSTEKVAAEYKGDWSKLGDVVRANIAVDKAEDVPKVIDALRARGVEFARAPKDRFSNPTVAGYRDAMFNVKYPSGHIGELQVHLKPMLLAKEGGGHALYEATRSLEAKAKVEGRVDAEGKPRFTPAEKKSWDETMEKSRAFYGGVWSKIQ